MTFTKVLRDAGLGERATAHGFRSSFKNWCSETARVADEFPRRRSPIRRRIAKAAYLRTDFFDARKSLMRAWEAHCLQARVAPSRERLRTQQLRRLLAVS